MYGSELAQRPARDQLALCLLAEAYPPFAAALGSEVFIGFGLLVKVDDPQGWIWVAGESVPNRDGLWTAEMLREELGLLTQIEHGFEALGVPLRLTMPPEIRWTSLSDAVESVGAWSLRFLPSMSHWSSRTYFLSRVVWQHGEWLEQCLTRAPAAGLCIDIARSGVSGAVLAGLRPALKLSVPAQEQQRLCAGSGVVLGPRTALVVGYAECLDAIQQPLDMVCLKETPMGLRVDQIVGCDQDDALCVLSSEPLQVASDELLSQSFSVDRAYLQLLQAPLHLYLGGVMRGTANLVELMDHAVLNITDWQ